MSNIPTIKEILKDNFKKYHPSQYDDLQDVQFQAIYQAMKNSITLHVEAAEKAAITKANNKIDKTKKQIEQLNNLLNKL